MRISIALLVSTALLIASEVNAQFGLDNENSKQMVMSNLSAMPLAFTENRGQWDEEVLFRAEAGGAVFFFCADEVVYVFTRDTNELMDDGMPGGGNSLGIPDKFDRPRYKKESMVIKAQFVGANPDAEILGEERLGYNCNYFLGNDPAEWRTDVPNYSTITYKDIWPGIDLRYHGNGQGMKYDFIVNRGADLPQIRVRYDRVDNLAITSNGDLQADTRFGLIYENIPSVYQEAAGSRHNISGQYRIIEPGVFGFEVEDYNPAVPLVIDPELIYSTYLGGSGDDWGNGITVDGSGNAYVIGRTSSTDFPIQNPYQADQLYDDAFITKLSASGSSLIYSTYIGGNNNDWGFDIAVDGDGNANITGETHSSDFPTSNPYQTDRPDSDAFAAKLAVGGNSLIYSTYLGGNNYDYGNAIALDLDGSAYIMGLTYSDDFPTFNPYQTDQPLADVFVAKLAPSGSSLVYSTYVGGNLADHSSGIAVDGGGNAYLTGGTYSTDFPVLNPIQTDQPLVDGYVTKLASDGSSIVYSSYLGGDFEDWGCDIAVDIDGNAYITGYTVSTNFPTVNSYQTNQPLIDGFVAKLDPTGSSLVYSTYLGGDNDDWGYGIAVDGNGNAYITGYTFSTDFPTLDSYQTDQPGGDVFVTKLAPDGNSVAYSTYIGGNDYDHGRKITLDGGGNAFIIGETSSSDFPAVNAYDGSANGYYDAFVAKFGAPAEPIPALSQWGMLIMGMILLGIGTIAVVKRKRFAFSKAI